MKRCGAIVLLLVLLTPAAAFAAPPRILVADVELVDLAPADQRYDQAEDAQRALMLTQRIRAAIKAAPDYHLLDRGKDDRTPPYSYRACRACVVDWGRRQGADRILVTWVQKESRLIVGISMIVIDVAHPQRYLGEGSVDLRNDTGPMWRAGASQLLQRTMGVAMAP